MNSRSSSTIVPATKGAPFRPPSPQKALPPHVWLWNAWLYLSGPSAQRFGTDIASQEQLRRSRLLSALLLVISIGLILDIPANIVGNPQLRVPILIVAVAVILAIVFNHSKYCTIAGVILIVGIDLTITAVVYNETLTLVNARINNLDLLVLSILIASLVLQRKVIPFIGGFQIVLLYLIITFVPRDASLRDIPGLSLMYIPGLLIFVSTTFSWLGAWSIDKALQRANRAEELAEIRARLNEQARQTNELNLRLEYGIATLKEAQSRVANGDYKARANLTNNELFPLGVSFNLMAERLEKALHMMQDYRRLQSLVQYLLQACNNLYQSDDQQQIALQSTGTLIDPVLFSLRRLNYLQQAVEKETDDAEKARQVVQRLQEQLKKMESLLSTLIIKAQRLLDETSRPLSQPLPPFSSPSIATKNSSDDQLMRLSSLHMLLQQQIASLEELNATYIEAQQLSGQGVQKVGMLSKELKALRYEGSGFSRKLQGGNPYSTLENYQRS